MFDVHSPLLVAGALSATVLGLICGCSNDDDASASMGGSAGADTGANPLSGAGGEAAAQGRNGGADPKGGAGGGAGANPGGTPGADPGGAAGAGAPPTAGAGGEAGAHTAGSAGVNGGASTSGTVTLNVTGVATTHTDDLLYVKLVAGTVDCSSDTTAGVYSTVGTATAGTYELVIESVAAGIYTACGFVDDDGNAQPSPGDLVGNLSLTVAGDVEEDWNASGWLTLPGSSQQPDLITWTYNGQPVGLYVPEAAGGPLPVVMFLHGYTNDPIASPPWIISAINAIEPCAVFVPFRPAEEEASAWGGTYDADLRPGMVDALAELDRVIDEQGFDTTRQYLYGESMGAEGVFMLLVQFPTRFAGAVAVAGYTLDTGASEMAQTPLWILHGSEDDINATSSSQTIYASILAAGGTQVTYTEYPGLGHSPAIVEARSEPGLLEWLLAQRRE